MKIRGIKTFCKTNRIELAVLFGSAAVSGFDNAADIDIAVKYKRGMKPSKLESISRYLEDLLPHEKNSPDTVMKPGTEIQVLNVDELI